METVLQFIGLILGYGVFLVGLLMLRITNRAKHVSKPGTISKNVQGEAREQNRRQWRNYYRAIIDG